MQNDSPSNEPGHEVWTEIVESYLPIITKITLKLAREFGLTIEDGEDIAHNFILQLLRSPPKSIQRLDSWIYVALRRKAVDLIRRRKTRRKYLPQTEIREHHLPQDTAESSELAQPLAESIDQLEDEYRTIIIRKLTGESIAEIAEKTNSQRTYG